jgi:hypothetical protein
MSVHINSTDTVYLVFDSPPIVIGNENGESFLRIVGTIENYQALNTAWGQITEIEYFSFRVKNSDYNTTSEAYSISLQERNPIDDNALGEKLDLTIKIPDYIPFGTIPHSDMYAAISFENYNNMYVDIPNTDSTDRPGPSDGDNTPPNLTYTAQLGSGDMPSVIINGNVTDNVGVDYVAFETIIDSGDGSTSWHSVSTFMIPANMIDSNGDFSVEYIPPPWAIKYQTGNMYIDGGVAFDGSGNFALSGNSVYGFFETGNENYIPVYYEEYERNKSGEWYFRFNLDDASISSNGHVINLNNTNGQTGSYANLTEKSAEFNGISIPAKTILMADGTTLNVSDNFFNNNTYDGAEVKIYSTFGDDYINITDGQQDIQFYWSPGNDVYFTELREDDYHNAEFIGIEYNYYVEGMNVSNPNGIIFDNSLGPALIATSDYGTTVAYNISEIETTDYNDTIIGRDNFYENIRLFKGQDVISTGYGSDTIRTKQHDTDSSSNYLINDFSSFDRI